MPKVPPSLRVVSVHQGPPEEDVPEVSRSRETAVGTGAGIIFKGSGFYATDYRKPGYTKAAKKESDSTVAASSGAKESTSRKPQANKTARE